MAARQRGVKNGRRSILTPELKAKTNRLLASKLPARQIAAELGIAAGTLYKWQRTGVLNDTSEEVEVEPVNRSAG